MSLSLSSSTMLLLLSFSALLTFLSPGPAVGFEQSSSTSTNGVKDPSYFTCVDKNSGNYYTTLLQPCIVTLYQVDDGTFPFDDVKNPEDVEYVNGVLETCSILEGYELKKFATKDIVLWEDPCVALKERCYDMEYLTWDQRDSIASILEDESSMTSANAGLDALFNQTTHIAVNCTADYQAKQDLAKALVGAGTALLGSVMCCCCSCIGIAAIVAVAVVICCCQQQQQNQRRLQQMQATANTGHHPVAAQVEIATVGFSQTTPAVAKPIAATARPAAATAELT